MADFAGTTFLPALHISRVPGEQGPIVRCSGELTTATTEALKRELDLLIGLRHPALVLGLTGCRSVDMGGVMLLLDTQRRLYAAGHRFAVVAGTSAAQVLPVLGLDGILPVFPSEQSATRALRGGGPPEAAPVTWSAARKESLSMWRAILLALQDQPAEEVMRRITSSHGLCRKAEEAFQSHGSQGANRCYVCPLFYALGAKPQDLGCQSLTQPMLEALLTGDRRGARVQVARLIGLIEAMPLPENEAGQGAVLPEQLEEQGNAEIRE